MKDKKEEELNNRYSRIRKRHPRVKLEPLDKVKNFIKEECRTNKKGITKRDVVNGLNISEREAERCVKYLSEESYITVSKGRKRVFFFSAEKKDGSFEDRSFGRENILDLMKRKFKDLISFVRKHPKMLDKELEEDFSKVVSTANSETPNIEAYNKVVQFAGWSNGFNDLVKLSYRSTANRYVA